MPRKQLTRPKYHPSPYARMLAKEDWYDLFIDLLFEKDEKVAVRNFKRIRRQVHSFPEIAKPLGLASPRRPGRPRGSRRKFELESLLVTVAVDWCGLTRREAMSAYRRERLSTLDSQDHHWLTRHLEVGRPLVLDCLKEADWIAIKEHFDSLTPSERQEKGKGILRALSNPA